MGGSEAECKEVNPLRIKARMSAANRMSILFSSLFLWRIKLKHDSTDSDESASRSSQIGLGNVSHFRVNNRQGTCAARDANMMMDQEKRNSPEKAGLEEIDLERRVKSKVDVLKELWCVKVSECSFQK
jgi:hypothetical protein